MKKFLVFSMLSCLLLLGGCARQTPPPYNLATSIQITCQHQDVLIERNYTSQDKMKAVLEANASHPVPTWIDVNRDTCEAKIVSLPTRDQIDAPIEEQLIVEFYSK